MFRHRLARVFYLDSCYEERILPSCVRVEYNTTFPTAHELNAGADAPFIHDLPYSLLRLINASLFIRQNQTVMAVISTRQPVTPASVE